VLIVGSSMREGATVPTHNNTKGLVRAFDVKTGKQLWRFNTIPRPGEFGSETWENNSWAINGNTGVWSHITADEELGLVYIPIETPTSDYYGGHRPGNNLFAESLVAVDIKTGVRKWHFQFVHHPIWNWDMTTAPVLADTNVNLGAIIPGTATNWPGFGYDPDTHTAFMPTGNIMGVRTLVQPPGEYSDIRFLAGIGGQQFREILGPGDCCAVGNPRTAERARAARNPNANAPAGFPGGSPLVQGIPITKPPYGMLSAIDLDKGEVKWQTPHGDTPDVVRNSPALRGINIPKTGQAQTSGVGL